MLDPRVGRFFAVDPLAGKYPWYTPYQFSGNKVIQAIELEGLEEYMTTDGVSLGQVGDDTSKRVMVGIASGTKESKNIKNAIKIVNQISSEINKGLEKKPEAVATEYLNHPRIKDLLKVHDKLETELFNGSESKLMYKLKKFLDIEVGTSQYWGDTSNFSSKDLGNGKIAFQMSDTKLFILMNFYRPSAFNNSQFKIFRTDKDLATEIYRVSMKAKKIFGAGAKIRKVTDEVIFKLRASTITKVPYDVNYFKNGQPTGGGALGNFESLKAAQKEGERLIKKYDYIDSVSITRAHY